MGPHVCVRFLTGPHRVPLRTRRQVAKQRVERAKDRLYEAIADKELAAGAVPTAGHIATARVAAMDAHDALDRHLRGLPPLCRFDAASFWRYYAERHARRMAETHDRLARCGTSCPRLVPVCGGCLWLPSEAAPDYARYESALNAAVRKAEWEVKARGR